MAFRPRPEHPSRSRLARRCGRSARRGFAPTCEPMEARTLLAALWVTDPGDNGGVNPAPFAGTGTLRQAIVDADATSGASTIDFNLGGGGHQVITLASAPPPITNTVTIDGTSQPGYAGKPLVEINGNGLDINILTLQAPNCVVKGLVVNHLGSNANDTAIQVSAKGAVIQGNFVGTDSTGTVASPAGIGIGLQATGCLVGGTTAGAGNVISRNDIGIRDTAGGNTIQGNFVGTDVTGTIALGNAGGIVCLDDTIGGIAPAARNIISGNRDVGVNDASNVAAMGGGSLIEGNYVGTDVTGNAPLGNGRPGSPAYAGLDLASGEGQTVVGNVISANSMGVFAGAYVTIQGNLVGTNASGTAALGNVYGITTDWGVPLHTLIGGTAPGQGNLVSGNTQTGIEIGNPAPTDVVVQGNKVGTDIRGTAAVPNAVGIDTFGSQTIGGTVPGAGNLISGNTQIGLNTHGGLVEGNLIGTDVSGTRALGNLQCGVQAYWAVTIGGTTSSARNVIAGNGTDVRTSYGGAVVEGNYIGVDVTGEVVLTRGDGIEPYGATVGGTAPGAGNVIAAGAPAVDFPQGSLFEGNKIGTNKEGTTHLGGRSFFIRDDTGNTVGGTTAGAGNLISGEAVLIGPSVTGNVFQGNTIDGDIAFNDGPHDNLIGGTTPGAGNVFLSDGVRLVDDSTSPSSVHNAILGNTFTGPTAKPISLVEYAGVYPTDVGAVNHPAGTVTGPNNAQNYPLISAAYAGPAATVIGTLNGVPNASYRVEFYASPAGNPPGQGPGVRFLGSAQV